MMGVSSTEIGGRSWATVIVFSVTSPSKMEPLMSFASIFFFSTDAIPRSGYAFESTCPKWICPSSWATKRMRWVQFDGMMADDDGLNVAALFFTSFWKSTKLAVKEIY